MNIPCEVIKDLLPLYHDEVSSNESNKIVEKHLESCDKCRSYLDSINTEILTYTNKSKEEEAKIHSLIKLRKKFRIKYILISMFSIIGAVILFIIALNFIHRYEFIVPYRDDILSLDRTYNTAEDILRNKDYYKANVIFKLIEKDGNEEVIAYIYYTKVLWNNNDAIYSNRISNLIDDFDLDDWENYRIKIESYIERLSAIYYFVGNYDKLNEMSNEKFFIATKDAVLIWEK